MKKVKRKFDYMEFWDNYGIMFDAEKYTKKEAIEIAIDEFDYKYKDISDVNITEEYVRWKPKMSRDDMWHYDIYDKNDNRGIYQTCDKNDKNAFKVWRVKI